MITGEYLVLEGALSLAIPVKFGQDLRVSPFEQPVLQWRAYDPDSIWFTADFSLPTLDVIETSDPKIADFLKRLLEANRRLQPAFLMQEEGCRVETHLTFHRQWGLGSSSTLIHNLSQWAGTDPYRALWSVSGGSGYDIACAGAAGPIMYRLLNSTPEVREVKFSPPFRSSIWFVYLGKKQDSAAAIKAFREKSGPSSREVVDEISHISQSCLATEDFSEFCQLMMRHEQLISKVIGVPPIQDTLFKGFPGVAKSLGAWGGDFVMLCSDLEIKDLKIQLEERKLKDFFTFEDIILKH